MVQLNYLESELQDLIQSDSAIWDFVQGSALDGISFWDLEKPENEWISPEFWQTFGMDPATKRAATSEWQDIIFEKDLHIVLDNVDAHCADPNHPFDNVVRYRHLDGSTVWIRSRGMAIRNSDGRPVRMFGVHSNITAEKNAAIEATENASALKAAQEELRSFSYSMSHDMKAPANTMGLLLSELVDTNRDKLDEDALELLSMCTVTVERMKNLVEYILDYTRIIGMEPQTSAVAISDATKHAINNLSTDIALRKAEIQIDPLPTITAAPLQMNILMQNLISNAIKYTPADRVPKVRVHSEVVEARDIVRISVTDNGMGIRADNQDRVFKLFQRLHGHNEIPGSGIGLPMCRRIAQNHSGTLELVSSLQTGSTFSFCLPTRALV